MNNRSCNDIDSVSMTPDPVKMPQHYEFEKEKETLDEKPVEITDTISKTKTHNKEITASKIDITKLGNENNVSKKDNASDATRLEEKFISETQDNKIDSEFLDSNLIVKGEPPMETEKLLTSSEKLAGTNLHLSDIVLLHNRKQADNTVSLTRLSLDSSMPYIEAAQSPASALHTAPRRKSYAGFPGFSNSFQDR